jgi:hypothetical protein
LVEITNSYLIKFPTPDFTEKPKTDYSLSMRTLFIIPLAISLIMFSQAAWPNTLEMKCKSSNNDETTGLFFDFDTMTARLSENGPASQIEIHVSPKDESDVYITFQSRTAVGFVESPNLPFHTLNFIHFIFHSKTGQLVQQLVLFRSSKIKGSLPDPEYFDCR